jgi:CBS domain-containing protein
MVVTVHDIMSRQLRTLERNQTLDVAEEIMLLERIRHLPVVEEGRVVGVVSQRDLFRSALAAVLGYGQKAREALLRTVRVKEVMSEPVITIAPSASVQDAARLMVEHKIGCLPVVEGEALVGLVTETDVLRCFAAS